MKIKLPKLLVKPKNLLSKHINSLISHAFTNSKRSSSSHGKSRTMGELFNQHKAKMICHRSLSFRDFLDNNNDITDAKKTNIFKKKTARRATCTGNNDALIAKEGSKNSGRILSITASGRRKSTKFAKVMQNDDDDDEDDDESGGIELCKKRILMGEKCRPLNISGFLSYDETGILLPEEIF